MELAFGSGILYGTQLTDYAGNAIVNPTPVRFGVLQDVSLDISFDTKTLFGQNQFPVAVGRGKGKVSGKAKFAQINGATFNSLFFGQTLSVGQTAVIDQVSKVSATATETVANSATFTNDLGVWYSATGLPLKRVASAPAIGQYSVAAGVYTFAAGDTAADAAGGVLISYEYTISATGVSSTIINPLMGYAPSFRADLFMPYNGQQMVVTLYKAVASKLTFASKQDDFAIPEFDFDCFANAGGQVLTYNFAE